MANDDWLAENLDWSDRQENLFAQMAGEYDVLNDEMLQQVFHVGFFDYDVDTETRMAAREYVTDYLESEYGIIFDEAFDWDTWREMYGDS